MFLQVLRIAVPFVWFGLVAGISFMEAPLKFQAPNITIEVGLGIGRLVFSMLNKIELALAALMIFSLFFSRPPTKNGLYPTAAIIFILFLQSIWLLPALDARAILILNGNPPPPSHLHLFYIFADALKLVLLIIVGVSAVRALINSSNKA